MTKRRIIIPLAALAAVVVPRAASAADGAEIDFRPIVERIERNDLSGEETARLVELAHRAKEQAKAQMTLVQRVERALIRPWVVFGFLAQFAFMLRFVVQLIASERKKRSYVPVAFWYLSLAGGTMLFVYALRLRDPVFVFGQGLGCLIYIRNLILIYRRKGAHRELQELRRERTLQAALEGAGAPDAADSASAAPPRSPS